MMNPKPESVEQYLSWFEPPVRGKLEELRAILKNALPECQEVISYHMPAYKTSEVLVYFAAPKKHLGFYPTNSAVREFKEELSRYITSKGAIQFPYDQPLPDQLIQRIAQFRREEDKLRACLKKKK